MCIRDSPCNRPVIDPITQRVVAGYGILTPRMGVTLDSADRTPFSRVMAGQGGITAYDVVAGDLYMDGFEESIFAGKGLIDVEAFALVTEEVFPPEQVLSHDILEGSLLRTGLVSDVEMTDGVPLSLIHISSSSRSISAPFSLCFSMLILLCSDKDSMYNSP